MFETVIKILTPILPAIILILGGQKLIDNYAIKKKRKEIEIELIKKSREEKYLIIKELYILFSEFMRLYRKINSQLIDIKNKETQLKILDEIYNAEAQIEGIILKIGCEFLDNNDDKEEVEGMLGNLRQSIQIWREKVTNGERLPFTKSSQDDYMRFKTSFSYVAAFMTNKIYDKLEKPEIRMQRVEELLVGSFDNKYEKWNQNSFEERKTFKKYWETPK